MNFWGVGGGYPPTECGLSNGALRWMVSRLARIGLRFGSNNWPADDALGLEHRPWLSTSRPRGLRTFPAGFDLSSSCVARLAAPSAPSAPGAAETEGAPPILAAYRPQKLVPDYLAPISWAVRDGVT